MVEVSDIIDKYKSNPKHISRVSPILLFIMMNSQNILKTIPNSNGQRINIKERRIAFRQAWDKLDYIEKAKYIEAATALGYISRISNTTIEGSSSNLISKLKAMRMARVAAKNPTI